MNPTSKQEKKKLIKTKSTESNEDDATIEKQYQKELRKKEKSSEKNIEMRERLPIKTLDGKVITPAPEPLEKKKKETIDKDLL